MDENKRSILHRLYYDANHPAGFGTAENLYQAAKKENVNISLGLIKKWLTTQKAFSVHKSRRKKFQRRQTVAPGINHQLQADLVDLSAIKRENGGNKFILTAIDVFSRFAFAVAIKNKSALEVLRGFEKIITNENTYKLLQVDDGKEFWNRSVKDFMQQNNIKMFSTGSGQKASIVERFNRTLKTRMFKYFTANNTLKYVDVLESLLNSYNSRKHRIIGVAPRHVSKGNEKEIWKHQYKHLKKYSVNTMYKIGDKVRITRVKNIFEKGYVANFTNDIFTIANILNTTPPTYYLKDKDDEILKGAFYREEIQKIHNG